MNELLPEISERALPSGRSVVLRVGSSEELEIRSPEGLVEVRITLTDSGPVVQLSGAHLHLDSTKSVQIRCDQFDVQAEEMRVKTEGDIHMNAAVIRLNC